MRIRRQVHRKHRFATRLLFERLESRLAMAGVVIHEFLAANATGLLDQDGDRSDWIELKNTDAVPSDLTGWYLTDDATKLTKWQLPATNLPAGGYQTIFASSKNRAVAGQELHTNFALSKQGEFLALVMPDGLTIASSFDPFPAQFDDISYGTGTSSSSTADETLVGPSSTVRVISPTAANAAVDDHWTEISFNDAGWLTGTRSVGFDRNSDGIGLASFIGRTLTAAEMDSNDASPQFSAYVRFPFSVADKDQLTSLQMDLRFDDGFIAYLNGQEIARVNFGEDFVYTQPQWNSYAGNQTTSSTAGAANRIGEADDLVTFDVTPFLSELANGANVLAFHAVNSNSTSGSNTNRLDFLVEPVLKTTRATAAVSGTYMAAPTPGDDNGLGTLGFVADTNFSIKRGFFSTAQSVEITTATSGATIRFTTDGSVPTLTNGSTYTGPINVAATTTLRAAAFKSGFTPTNVDTQTYIFVSDVILQSAADVTQPYATWGHDKEDSGSESGYNLDDESDWAMDPDIVTGNEAAVKNALLAIPTMSVVMDWNDLFGGAPLPGTFSGTTTVAPAPQGIYIMGRSSERRNSLEFINPAAASDQFQIDAGIEIQGHSSPTRWNSDKLSFQVKFKDLYGPSKLEFPLFTGSPDGEHAAAKFDTLILDAMFNYSWIHANATVQSNYARFVTDQVVSDLQNMASHGGQAPHGKYVHLYLNGLYWGLYNVHERPDDAFAAEYYGGNKDDYYAVKHANTDIDHEYTWVEGGLAAEQAYQALLDASRQNMTIAANYDAVAGMLDVDQFIDYMIVHYYAGGGADWSHNNWYATFNAAIPGGKWRFHAWDQEHAFPTTDNDAAESDPDWNEFSDLTGKDDPETPTELFRNLIVNSEFKVRFADRVQVLMHNGGALTESAAQAAYVARLNEIDQAIIGESARWGDNRFPTDPYTRQDWIDVNLNDATGDQKAVVPDFFPVRSGVVLADFAGWLPSLDAPEFTNYGGEVVPGFDVTMTKPVGSPAAAEIYYTTNGSDPRLVGGATNPDAQHAVGPIAIDIDAAKRVMARIKNGTEWSALIDATFTLPDPFPVRISELHYHPAIHPGVTDPDDLEFIELVNTGSGTVNLAGLQITQFATTPYTFGSIDLTAGARIVVARDPAIFQSVYGADMNLSPAGYSTANLSNGGERIALIGPYGETLQDFNYDDSAPWPVSPDGDGPSLEIVDPLGDPASPENWRASASAGGSPGTAGLPDPIPGDYDGNRTVEQADYTVWRSTFGTNVNPGTGADGNGDGTVDAADYAVWRRNLGATGPSPSAGSTSAGPTVLAAAATITGNSIDATPVGRAEFSASKQAGPRLGHAARPSQVGQNGPNTRDELLQLTAPYSNGITVPREQESATITENAGVTMLGVDDFFAALAEQDVKAELRIILNAAVSTLGLE
jgi:hypothetical protein